jgi:hypothetical protein
MSADGQSGITLPQSRSDGNDGPPARPSPVRNVGSSFLVTQRFIALMAVVVVGGLLAIASYLAGQYSVRPPASISTSATAQNQQLQQQINVLQSRVNTTSGLLDFLLAALVALLALGGLTSFVSWYRAERRQYDAASLALDREYAQERRSQEAHRIYLASADLAMAGERSNQVRAEAVHEGFLEGSRQTLDLVNGTLVLARDASERAANAIQRKAETTRDELDKHARRLIEECAPEDDHELVADHNKRSELISLAHRIASFEVNQFILPSEVPLTPSCQFIRGLHHHLEQQSQDAIECWRDVASAEIASKLLRSRAWFWIGYESNNLGDFPTAERAFDRAKEFSDGDRLLELERIHLESRFFNRHAESITDLLQRGDALLEEMEASQLDAGTAERVRLTATVGNIYHQAGREMSGQENSKGARQYFQRAYDLFQAADRTHYPWSDFGLAEAAHELGELDVAKAAYDRVREAAKEEYYNRIEPRTRARARTTELISLVRTNADRALIESTYNSVLETLGQVDEHLTVYSPIQRRNMRKPDFRSDLEAIMDSLEDDVPAPRSTW